MATNALKSGVFIAVAISASVTTLSTSAATITVEVAAEGRTQITAPQEWLQLLTKAGAANVRIRGARGGEKPEVEAIGSRGDVYRVVGVLTSRGELAMPGGRFGRRDVSKLRDYFDRLSADGPEALTATTGSYGLTKEQFEKVFAELSKSVVTPTQGRPLEEFVRAAEQRLDTPIVFDRAANTKLRSTPAVAEELKKLTLGAALAIALRQEGLALAPTKPRGEPVQLRVLPLDEKIKAGDDCWPIGYEYSGPTRNVAPDMMESINVEIDGYTLAEATAAITPRLETAVLWDHWSMTQRGIDPATESVRLPRAKLSYKRILEKLVSQAHLSGRLRTDEAGTPFFWISARR